MIENIKSALKTEYKGLGLSDKTIDRLASYVKGLVENEDDIATAVKRDDVKLIATSIQGEIDGIRKAKQAAEDALKEYKEKHPEGDKTETKDDESEVARQLRELLEKQTQMEARLKAKDDAELLATNRSAVEAKLKQAGCTNVGILKSVLKGFALGENEDVDAATERLKGEYNSTYKETFGEGPRPGFGGSEFGGDPKKSADRMNDYLRQEGLLPAKE